MGDASALMSSEKTGYGDTMDKNRILLETLNHMLSRMTVDDFQVIEAAEDTVRMFKKNQAAAVSLNSDAPKSENQFQAAAQLLRKAMSLAVNEEADRKNLYKIKFHAGQKKCLTEGMADLAAALYCMIRYEGNPPSIRKACALWLEIQCGSEE